eukprot:TRINITY_DN12810_c0_g2_i1.p1 TRINITY_DN12810_c0_g2~~TRINITY_DN12810_c0_g2_i1.p1  ORF type:complete len:239 (-),score=10.12 TRINITY_DN12810_c0_g2_i1:245-961(-)
MAHAYKYVPDPSSIQRIFILGPSHNLYTQKCLLSSATEQSTPFGTLQVDLRINRQLMQTGIFDYMSLNTEENEHSLEMHLPFISHVMKGQTDFTVVPIMVGALTYKAEEEFGRVLSPYLNDQSNFFIISSDFCHWGRGYKYMYINHDMETISDSIKWLDGIGMKIIEQVDPIGFANYLKKYNNTICGRHPIAIFLQMLSHSKDKFQVSFKDYRQSERCLTMSDISVSYAAAVVSRMPT